MKNLATYKEEQMKNSEFQKEYQDIQSELESIRTTIEENIKFIEKHKA